MKTYVMSVVSRQTTGKVSYAEIVPTNSPKLDSRITSQLKRNMPKGLRPYMPFKFFDYGGGEGSYYEYFVVKMTPYEKKQINKSIKSGMTYDDILHLIFSIEIDRMVFPDIDGQDELSELLTDDFYQSLGGA